MEDVIEGSAERSLREVFVDHELRLGLDVLFLDQLVEFRWLVELAPVFADDALAAARRLLDLADSERDEQAHRAEHHKHRPPREERDEHARDEESDPGTDQLAALHPTEHAAADVGRERVTHDRGHRRTTRSRHDTEGDTRREQHRE